MGFCVLPLKKTSWTDTLYRATPSRSTVSEGRSKLEQCRDEKQVRDKMRWRMSGVFGTDTARHGGLATARPTNNGNACFLLIESKCSKLRQDRKVLVSPWQTNVQQKLCLCAKSTHQKPNETALATLRCQRDGRAYKV